MHRIALVFSVLLLFVFPVLSQQPAPNPPPQNPSYAAIPVEAARAQNPVKSTPESLARAKRGWKLDCEMCHGKNGDGKGETAKDMKLTMADFTDPATLKDHTDGEIFYIIKNGHNAAEEKPPQ